MTPYSAKWPRRALIVWVFYRMKRSRVRNAMPAACCSMPFTATNRIVGREAASAMASASALSFGGKMIHRGLLKKSESAALAVYQLIFPILLTTYCVIFCGKFSILHFFNSPDRIIFHSALL